MPRIPIAKASEILGVSEGRLRRLCREGRIPSAEKTQRKAWFWTVELQEGNKLEITPTDHGQDLTI
jgi:predicted site-specific integrase-resolvase